MWQNQMKIHATWHVICELNQVRQVGWVVTIYLPDPVLMIDQKSKLDFKHFPNKQICAFSKMNQQVCALVTIEVKQTKSPHLEFLQVVRTTFYTNTDQKCCSLNTIHWSKGRCAQCYHPWCDSLSWLSAWAVGTYRPWCLLRRQTNMSW